MFRVLIAGAFVTIFIAWVLAEILSALGCWSDAHPNSEPARDIDIEIDPAKHRGEFDFGALSLAFTMVLLFLIVPTAVTSNGQLISLHEFSDSMRASGTRALSSMDVGTVNAFVSAWRADDPLEFWAFFAGLPVIVIWLFRRSPGLLGVAMVAALFVLWLR